MQTVTLISPVYSFAKSIEIAMDGSHFATHHNHFATAISPLPDTLLPVRHSSVSTDDKIKFTQIIHNGYMNIYILKLNSKLNYKLHGKVIIKASEKISAI